MTYNEWRDELKSNLLSVSEAERRRVLDYYAEAYADRRDAGYTEREIVEDFGAPYDAAQRILAENAYADYDEPRRPREERKKKDRKREEYYSKDEYFDEPRRKRGRGDVYEDDYYSEPPRRREEARKEAKPERENHVWVFVLLCIIFCVPLFGIIVGLIGATIGLCAAPFALLIGGVATMGAGIGAMFTDLIGGACTLGIGLIIFGVSLIIMPLMFKLIKLLWKLFTAVMGAIKNLFSGKEKA
ncbi:MAG: DUF1700 domain-containing protein [Clostridia bacterium]|nr:DUF1700 domain-containing protein [Clostridia bacterium]